jgi:hypothetical protein
MRSIMLIVAVLVVILMSSGCSTSIYVSHEIPRAEGRVGNRLIEAGDVIKVEVPGHESYVHVSFRDKKTRKNIGSYSIYVEFQDSGSMVVITEDMLEHSGYGHYGHYDHDDSNRIPVRYNPRNGMWTAQASGEYYQPGRPREKRRRHKDHY